MRLFLNPSHNLSKSSFFLTLNRSMAYIKIIPADKSDLVEEKTSMQEESSINDENFLYEMKEGRNEVEKTSNIKNQEYKLESWMTKLEALMIYLLTIITKIIQVLQVFLVNCSKMPKLKHLIFYIIQHTRIKRVH